MRISTPTLLLDARAELGEGPSWDVARQLLYWINIYAGEVHVYDPTTGQDRAHALGQSVGCVAPARSGRLVLAVKEGLAILDLFTAKDSADFLSAPTLKFLAQPELTLPGNRFNDGKCGPDGRFLAGSMEQAEEHNTGFFYSYSANGTLKTLLSEIGISNGLTWSPDYKTLYYIDTPTHNVMAYDYDLASGEIANPRLAVRIPDEFGWPDGMTSDTQGRLWVALWGGASLTVWDPATGKLLERIAIPAKNVSACCFGGPQRNQLYVTSARKGLDSATLAAYPLTGGLFRLDTDVEGMPTFTFGD